MHALTEWRDFYVMIGTASGAMIGATFIVATLTANLEKRALGLRGFITPSAVHLGSVLVGSAILTVPTLTPMSLAILLGAGGMGGADLQHHRRDAHLAHAARSRRPRLLHRPADRGLRHDGDRRDHGLHARRTDIRDAGRRVGGAPRHRHAQHLGHGELCDHAGAGGG